MFCLYVLRMLRRIPVWKFNKIKIRLFYLRLKKYFFEKMSVVKRITRYIQQRDRATYISIKYYFHVSLFLTRSCVQLVYLQTCNNNDQTRNVYNIIYITPCAVFYVNCKNGKKKIIVYWQNKLIIPTRKWIFKHYLHDRYIHINIYEYIHIINISYTYMHACIYIHTCIFTYIHLYIHTYIHDYGA